MTPVPDSEVAEYLVPCVPVTDETLEALTETPPPHEKAQEKLVFAMARELRLRRQGIDPKAVTETAESEPEDEPEDEADDIGAVVNGPTGKTKTNKGKAKS